MLFHCLHTIAELGWKRFMKIGSFLKLKLISNLNLLAFYGSPSPFLILFDMQEMCAELIEFVSISPFFLLLQDLISSNASVLLDFWWLGTIPAIIYPWCLMEKMAGLERDEEKVADWLRYLFCSRAAVWSGIHTRGGCLQTPAKL